MTINLLSILSLGFILGIKHALEPDHVIAISTIVSKTKKLWYSSLAGVFWGIGHTLTLFIFGMVFIVMKKEIPNGWVMTLEFFVGIMLVYLGVSRLFFSNRKNTHTHEHNHKDFNHSHYHCHEKISHHAHTHDSFSYFKSLIIGSIHGLAGSGAMILLTMTTVKSPLEGSIYILVFGIGTVIGMLLCTTLIGIPFTMTSKNNGINTILTRLAGGVSAIFGIYYMYNLGINEGLFKMWMKIG